MIFSVALAYPGQTRCGYCNKKLDGPYIVFGTKTYHQACYQDHVQVRCDHCKKRIDGQYSIFDDKSYHADCYEKHVQIRCDHCGNTISDAYNIDDDKKYCVALFEDESIDSAIGRNGMNVNTVSYTHLTLKTNREV